MEAGALIAIVIVVALLALWAFYYMKKGKHPKVGTPCSGANDCGLGGKLSCDPGTGKCIASSGAV